MVLKRIHALPADIRSLAELAEAEGFRHITRLADDFESGKHRFERPGEALFLISDCDSSVAIGGLTQSKAGEKWGRVRRLYVHPDFRRQHLGQQLMQAIHQFAAEHYLALELRTDTERAAQFYESLGYQRTENQPDATHIFKLYGTPG